LSNALRRINSVYVVSFLLGNSPASEFYMPTYREHSVQPSYAGRYEDILHTYLAYEDEIVSVPKRRRIKFRRRGITQKKGYNIPNTAKV